MARSTQQSTARKYLCSVLRHFKHYLKGKEVTFNLLIQWHTSMDVRVLKLQTALKLWQTGREGYIMSWKNITCKKFSDCWIKENVAFLNVKILTFPVLFWMLLFVADERASIKATELCLDRLPAHYKFPAGLDSLFEFPDLQQCYVHNMWKEI